VAGLCRDPLEELTALPRPPSWIWEGRGAPGKGMKRWKGQRGGERWGKGVVQF